MKITFLCPHVRIAGGVRAVLTHADRLAARGHEVVIVVPAGRALRAWWRNRAAAKAPAWMPALRAGIVWVPEWRADALPQGDAVIATAWQSAQHVADAPARCGRKLYFIQHYESLYHGDRARVDETYRLPLAKIVISSWLAEIMAERFASPAAVIVTPVDPALFHPVPAAGDGIVSVLMLHHDYAWKGVADGVEAVRRVRARHPALRLVGFGVKPPRGRSPYDEFVPDPPQERLAWLYSRSPIYLCPSWDEGLGMPPMEAMACGAALCTYDNGGCRDYAFDGRTAVVAPRRDVGALARALDRLVEDAGFRLRIAQEGRRFVTTAFDWDRATTRLEALIRGEGRRQGTGGPSAP